MKSSIRASLTEKRRKAAIVHLNKRIRTLEGQALDAIKTPVERVQLRRSIDFLSLVRDTTLHNLERVEQMMTREDREDILTAERIPAPAPSRKYFKDGEIEADIMETAFLA